MNWLQLVLNSALMIAIQQLKGGASATATALLSGQEVTLIKVNLGPEEVATVSVKIGTS